MRKIIWILTNTLIVTALWFAFVEDVEWLAHVLWGFNIFMACFAGILLLVPASKLRKSRGAFSVPPWVDHLFDAAIVGWLASLGQFAFALVYSVQTISIMRTAQAIKKPAVN